MIINMQSGGVVPERIIDAQTITPGTSNKTLTAGTYLRGAQTILGDADLTPENIKNGVDIFGVMGTMEEKTYDIDYGEVLLSSSADSITVNHNLGVVPQTVALFSKTIPSSDTLGGTWTAIKCHDVYAFTFGSKKYEYGKVADSIYGPNYFEITDNKITFLKRGDNYPLIGEYCWVAII